MLQEIRWCLKDMKVNLSAEEQNILVHAFDQDNSGQVLATSRRFNRLYYAMYYGTTLDYASQLWLNLNLKAAVVRLRMYVAWFDLSGQIDYVEFYNVLTGITEAQAIIRATSSVRCPMLHRRVTCCSCMSNCL